MKKKPRIPKWLKWEFWPYGFFYIPVYFLVAWHALRARTLAYFTLVNPGMVMGGFSAYSKYDVLRQLSSPYLPKTLLFSGAVTEEAILQKMHEEKISFPIILKPDEGERGWRVEKISLKEDLKAYLSGMPGKLLLQEYIDLAEEYGVMYYRCPSEKKGNISSLMKREFLTVMGNGKSTLTELFEQSERCLYYIDRLKQKFTTELGHVLPKDEVKVLEEIGNHNRGTVFLNANALISDELIAVFDSAVNGLHEWYFGRLDVKTNSFEEMLRGNFKVIEVNGANSEPAHIYDPQMDIFEAYKELFQHWKIIFKISMENRKRGFKPLSVRTVYRELRRHLRKKRLHPNII